MDRDIYSFIIAPMLINGVLLTALFGLDYLFLCCCIVRLVFIASAFGFADHDG